jgi:hypothetical protein
LLGWKEGWAGGEEKKRKEKDRWVVGLEEEMVRVWFCFFFFFLETLFKLFSNTNF